ncbi:choice-of-anchor A family protein [Paraglaciecola aquimarina]|uniref:Choice-of-anchor A family protein n=1 Tax=Paraglaciecola algarum TaxID=3050085 RepID=A0ABS9DD77_9ALTE|nr:collagen-binding domain-containing protein [Paraglaciecola sp. G1-23]MCF2949943.1 choice-of-anchor A family protein [Paraglaciecola sp. G1-23]
MKNKFLLSVVVSLSLLTPQVFATTSSVNTAAHVGTYNLILQGDLTTNSDIQGQAFINGNVNMLGQVLEVGAHLPSSPSVDAVTVVGNINASTVRVFNNNNIVYGDESNIGSTTFEGGTTNVRDTDILKTEFNAIWSQAVADSKTFKELTPTSVFDTADNNILKFKNDNSLDLNVFTITTDSLSSNGTFDFLSTPTVPVIINVSGEGVINLTSKPSGSFANFANASNVLWNFYEASTINFNSGSWYGSVLAPGADITLAGGNIDGGIAAKSLDAQSELHNALFTYTPPPSNDVPAPAGLLFMGLGLIFMGYRRFKK